MILSLQFQVIGGYCVCFDVVGWCFNYYGGMVVNQCVCYWDDVFCFIGVEVEYGGDVVRVGEGFDNFFWYGDFNCCQYFQRNVVDVQNFVNDWQ